VLVGVGVGVGVAGYRSWIEAELSCRRDGKDWKHLSALHWEYHNKAWPGLTCEHVYGLCMA
jgi:hypothetical protein